MTDEGPVRVPEQSWWPTRAETVTWLCTWGPWLGLLFAVPVTVAGSLVGWLLATVTHSGGCRFPPLRTAVVGQAEVAAVVLVCAAGWWAAWVRSSHRRAVAVAAVVALTPVLFLFVLGWVGPGWKFCIRF